MKKLLTLLLAFVMTMTAFVGCGGNNIGDGEQSLEIYCINKGYGIDWLNSTIASFKEQQWVKDAYPELKISLTTDGNYNTAHQLISSGKNYNTTDLIFSASLESYAGSKQQHFANLTESVYNSKVPGEGNITVAEKMLDGILSNQVYGAESENGNDVYYWYPYVSGYYGIIYNKTILDKMSIQVPVTTDEFVSACDTISNMNNDIYKVGYAIADNAKDGYWANLFEIWWAQYSSISGYKDFYYGIVGNTQSSDVFKDVGRLEALKVFEQIFKPDKQEGDYKYDANKSTYKYIYPYANEASTDYIGVQNGFLSGNGVFHANGDYFATEMQTYRKDNESAGYVYDLQFMRLPVISSIINVVPDRSIANDAELSSLVKAIDAGNTALVGDGYEVTQNDYNRVKEARSIVKTGGGNAVIPDYSSAKDLAVDFLKFMATDVCQEGYVKSSLGLTSAFEVSDNLLTSLDSYICDIQKSRIDIMGSSSVPIIALPSETSFPYEIKQFYVYDMTTTTLEAMFSAAKKTAQGIYEEEYRYWDTAQTKWQQMISGGNI